MAKQLYRINAADPGVGFSRFAPDPKTAAIVARHLRSCGWEEVGIELAPAEYDDALADHLLAGWWPPYDIARLMPLACRQLEQEPEHAGHGV